MLCHSTSRLAKACAHAENRYKPWNACHSGAGIIRTRHAASPYQACAQSDQCRFGTSGKSVVDDSETRDFIVVMAVWTEQMEVGGSDRHPHDVELGNSAGRLCDQSTSMAHTSTAPCSVQWAAEQSVAAAQAWWWWCMCSVAARHGATVPRRYSAALHSSSQQGMRLGLRANSERLQDVLVLPCSTRCREPTEAAAPGRLQRVQHAGRLGTEASVPRLGAPSSLRHLGSLGNLPRLRDVFQNDPSKHSWASSRASVPHTHTHHTRQSMKI